MPGVDFVLPLFSLVAVAGLGPTRSASGFLSPVSTTISTLIGLAVDIEIEKIDENIKLVVSPFCSYK